MIPTRTGARRTSRPMRTAHPARAAPEPSAALLVDDILPQRPCRQWVLTPPFLVRFLLAAEPELLSPILGIAYRRISGYLIGEAGLTRKSTDTGAVTLIQ
jgi:hypothetical protein